MKLAAILTAEGQKQAAILTAEGKRQSLILQAEGDSVALVTVQTAQATAIKVVFNAVTESHPTPEILKYLYLQTLPKMAEGTANKLFVVPSELGSFATMGATFGAGEQNGHAPQPVGWSDVPARTDAAQ